MMRQPHQRTAFDQTRALVGYDGLLCDQSRFGQCFPVLLPGLSLAILDQLDLQNRQRSRLHGEQNRLPKREDFIAQQKEERYACQLLVGQGLCVCR
jgi:hypothetical protein